MKIAIEGCCHGELDKIYETIEKVEKESGDKIDVLLICGDFQAVRNKNDLQTMAVPSKYRQLNTFYKYYSGEKIAPLLTIFIGGNHEASAFLQELPYGGWVAKNIYYLGYAGVINIKNVKIAGLSGIYKDRDYYRGHYERPPYDQNTLRSCYHIRNIDVFRLKQICSKIDIFLSHDWPQGIYDYGDVDGLLKRKKYFKQEIHTGSLGNPVAKQLLFKLKPKYWFSAHLHCKFSAVVGHTSKSGSPDGETKFLSLDKCLPNRKFLQIIEIPTDSDEELKIMLDAEWLSILKSTDHFFSLSSSICYLPGETSSERYDFSATLTEMEEVAKDFNHNFVLPDNFCHTAPPITSSTPGTAVINKNDSLLYLNPQTELFCCMLNLINPYAEFLKNSKSCCNTSYDGYNNDSQLSDSLMISTLSSLSSSFNLEKSQNPDEILLDDEEDENILDEVHENLNNSELKHNPCSNEPNEVPLVLDVSCASFSEENTNAMTNIKSINIDAEKVNAAVETGEYSTKQDQTLKKSILKRRNVAMYSIQSMNEDAEKIV